MGSSATEFHLVTSHCAVIIVIFSVSVAPRGRALCQVNHPYILSVNDNRDCITTTIPPHPSTIYGWFPHMTYMEGVCHANVQSSGVKKPVVNLWSLTNQQSTFGQVT